MYTMCRFVGLVCLCRLWDDPAPLDRVRDPAQIRCKSDAKRRFFMAVAVVLEFHGGTLDQYEQVIGKMGFTHGGKGAPGGLFHWVTATGDGIRVTDVWNS